MALCVPGTAAAGGLLLPGAGAVSTARAGASTVAADDAEAISLNPAGVAKANGTTITIGITAINYALSFQRNGTYDTNTMAAEPYAGQPYPVIENQSKPKLGIGSYQPVPVVGIVSDLGKKAGGLSLGFGLFTTNAYPAREMNHVNGRPYFVDNGRGGYNFPLTYETPPPPTRYDVIALQAAIILPSIVAAYRVTDDLDVGARFSAGFAEFSSSVGLWGGLANYPEWIQQDGIINIDAKDSFVPAWGLGVTYRATPAIELAATYNAQIDLLAKGDAIGLNGPGVDPFMGDPPVILPVPDDVARCAKGGTNAVQKGCVELSIPMAATIGGRYKFLDDSGKQKGDLELDVEWQNWGAERAGNFRVVVDAKVTTMSNPDAGFDLKTATIYHGLRDTYGARLGGSWNFDAGNNTVIARGGLGYESGAAKPGWERADLDGASRVMVTGGASYRMSRVQIDAGLGYVHEGTRTDSRTCNPALRPPPYEGCGAGGMVQPIDQRQGPDPINPLLTDTAQLENPVNQGTYTSHYLLLMLGMSTWF